MKKEFEHLKEIVKKVTGIDIENKSRSRNSLYARMVFYVILRDRGYTLQKIGGYLNKHHSTIIHAEKQFEALILQIKSLRDIYFECKSAFYDNKEPVFIQTDVNMSKKIIDLQSKIDSLILNQEKIQLLRQKYMRFKDILEYIDMCTPEGKEDVLYEKINRMFNNNSI